MEASRLIDPGFWASDEPVAPGADLPEGTGAPGLVYFRTSGSSGPAKWIGLRREALLLSAAVVNRHLKVTSDDVWGLALPLRHVGGFGVVARAFEAGSRLSVFGEKWDAGRFVGWLAAERVAHCPLVPTQVHDLVAAGLRAPASLRTVVVGGGVLGEREGREARLLGWPVLASYGMTEAGSQIATQGLELLGSPYVTSPLALLPHWEARTDDAGCIEVRGEALFSGALVSEAGQWRFREREGGWFRTSDLGEVTDGTIRIAGRADRRVKVLGELVDLSEIEDSIGGGVVVVARPDERAEHRLVAVAEDESAGRRVEEYNRRSAGPWRIGEWIKISELPRSAIGKIDRGRLGAWLEEQGI